EATVGLCPVAYPARTSPPTRPDPGNRLPGHPHETPRLLFLRGMTSQPGKQLARIPAIRLRPTGAAVYCDARRVDHSMLSIMADAKTGEPNPSLASFVATHHPGLLGHATAALGPASLLQDR